MLSTEFDPSSSSMRTSPSSKPSSIAAEALAPVDRLGQLDLGLVARPVLEIGRTHERTIDAGGRNFKPVFARQRIGHVEHRRQVREIVSQSSTLIDAVGPLGHDLHVTPSRRRVMTTRTSRKPRSSSTGSARAANCAARPVSPMKRLIGLARCGLSASRHRPANRTFTKPVVPKPKRADPDGAHSRS